MMEVVRWSGVVAFFLLAFSNIFGALQLHGSVFPYTLRPWTRHVHEYAATIALAVVGVHVWAVVMSYALLALLGRPAAMWGMLGLLLVASIILVWFERKRFGNRAWWWIHGLNGLAMLAIAVHGWLAGPDYWMRPVYLV